MQTVAQYKESCGMPAEHLGRRTDRMRLVVTAGPQRAWVGLEPETSKEATALEACAAWGE